MLHIVEGNLFDSDCDFLVNTVNCVGVPGKGLALQFAQRYPEVTARYVQECKRKEWKPGQIKFYDNLIFAATKDHWRYPSRYEWVDDILDQLADRVPDEHSIALPPLGAGLGGLDGRIVLSMVQTMSDLPFDVYYFLPT